MERDEGRTAGKTLGKVRVFKYGNGWIHATLNMNKPVGGLLTMTASFALGPTSWSWAKKKEKGKVKGKEVMLVKEMREQELGNGTQGRWRGRRH